EQRCPPPIRSRVRNAAHRCQPPPDIDSGPIHTVLRTPKGGRNLKNPSAIQYPGGRKRNVWARAGVAAARRQRKSRCPGGAPTREYAGAVGFECVAPAAL